MTESPDGSSQTTRRNANVLLDYLCLKQCENPRGRADDDVRPVREQNSDNPSVLLPTEYGYKDAPLQLFRYSTGDVHECDVTFAILNQSPQVSEDLFRKLARRNENQCPSGLPPRIDIVLRAAVKERSER